MAGPKLCFSVFVFCLVMKEVLPSHSQADADLIFDDLRGVQADSNALSNAISPLSTPRVHHSGSHRRKRTRTRWHPPTDDEDLYRDAEDGPSGEDSWVTHSGDDDLRGKEEPPTPETASKPEGPFYFRISLTITNLPYQPELAQKTSAEFKRVSEEIILDLEALYRRIRGQQAVTVISFRPLQHSTREPVLVTFDVGSLGNNDRNSIESVVKQAILSGSLGNYRLSSEGFVVRDFGSDITSRGDIPRQEEPSCSPNQLSCTSGECIDFSKDTYQHCNK